MALFKQVVEAFVASREFDKATLSRLAFWVDTLGDKEIGAITADDIDTAILKLAERGRLVAGKRDTARSGKPLAGSTINRHLTQAGSVFKHAKRLKLLPRAFVAPTRGIERSPERPALPAPRASRAPACRRACHGSALEKNARAHYRRLSHGAASRVDPRRAWQGSRSRSGTLVVNRTKNGDPIMAGLSTASLAELKRLPKAGTEELVFGSAGKPYTYGPLWERIAKAAGLEGRNFHQLRHGRGYMLARAGVSQQLIMASMGHKTLSASARYAHASIRDKQDVIARVFG